MRPRPRTPDTTSRERNQTLRLLLRNPTAVGGLIVLAVLLLTALVGPYLITDGPNVTNVATNALRPPSLAHPFGTDDLGRDILGRVVIASQVTIRVAVVSVSIALAVGAGIGILSGYVGGVVDSILMRIIDVLFAFPVLVLALAIVAIMGPGVESAMIAIGVVYIPIFARVTRASTLSVRQAPYVQAAKSMGVRTPLIIWRHVLPNISGPIIVQTSLSLAFAILSEAALSFLGLGIQPPNPSWGRMLFDAQGFFTTARWMGVFPGLAIFVTVLAFNLVGDGLRDVLDPRQRTILRQRGGLRLRKVRP